MNTFKDCSYSLADGVLTVGNALIERKIRLDEYGMTPLALTNRRTGKYWARDDAEEMAVSNPFGRAEWTCRAEIEDHDRLSDKHLAVHVTWMKREGEYIERVFEVYPGIAAVHMRVTVAGSGTWRAEDVKPDEYAGTETVYAAKKAENMTAADAIDLMTLPAGHYDLREIMLIDKSDQNDTLIRESVHPVYNHGWGHEEAAGNLFVFEDRMDGNACMLVKEAPTTASMLGRGASDLYIQKNQFVQLLGNGLNGQELHEEGVYAYGSTMLVGKKEEIGREWRRLYRAMWHGKEHVRVLSNTWGDRNQDKAVCHDFMMKEIARAHELGVQVVQIDDGWQLGQTANSALGVSHVWEGYYAANPDFWKVNEKKFPQGLKSLTEYAASLGIEMGLWFSPDSSNGFANWQKDAEVLLGFYRELGVRRFKLDGVKIRDKKSERNYLRLLEALNRESGGRICVNQDITAEIRLGQIYYREHGNLFVENRYTDAGSYYPHNTLKNLWELAEYIPAGKMQFECLNNARNPDKYPADDPLAPGRYDIDYLFAVTMAASPLMWMEMSNLREEDARTLSGVIGLYRTHQAEIARGDVQPIGRKPDGMSFTGFHVDLDAEGGYLILFREWTREEAFTYDIPQWTGRNVRIELLATNAGEASLEAEGSRLTLQTDRQRTYVFAKYGYIR